MSHHRPHTMYTSRISYRVPKLIFSRGREERLFEGGRLLQILSVRRGANSKRGAYLKLGANLSIYGIIIQKTRDFSMGLLAQ